MKIINNFSNFTNIGKSILGSVNLNINKQSNNAKYTSKTNFYQQVVNNNKDSAIHGKKSLDVLKVKLANGIDSSSLLTVNQGSSTGFRSLSQIGSTYNAKGETNSNSPDKSIYSFALFLEENA